MFHNILVAIDGSSTAQRALEHAIDLAGALNARLTILTVAPEIPAYARSAPVDIVALEQAAEDEAAKRLREAVDQVPESVSVTTILRHGHAGKEILAVSKDGTYDLIVMGSRGRARLASNVLGSVAADVHFATTLPMLIVHPERAG
jgi:nucleotide-binding universal stress UspA family protein